MKNGPTARGSVRIPSQQRTALAVVSGSGQQGEAGTGQSPAKGSIGALESGIVVREQELGTVKAQRMYKLRCECGRSWFELELPTLVECPACKKPSLVSA